MEKLSFVIENQLGVAKDNEELKNSLNGQFNGETAEVGLYLAMARVAQLKLQKYLKLLLGKKLNMQLNMLNLLVKYLTVLKLILQI